MSDNTADLSVYYPFLPASVLTPFMRAIREAHVVFTTVPEPGLCYRCKLSKDSTGYKASLMQGTSVLETVLLEVASISASAVARSYLLTADTSAAPATGDPDLYLHPMCIEYVQKAAKLSVKVCAHMPYDETTEVVELTELDFQPGYNVAVSGNSSSVRFLAASGIGKGVLQEPWDDIYVTTTEADWTRGPVCGLRAINGLTGDVNFGNTKSLTLSVTGGSDSAITVAVEKI